MKDLNDKIVEKVKEYHKNGIGFNCNTSDFYDLQICFKKSKVVLLEDLEFLEEEIKEFQNKISEIDYKNEGGLAIIKKDTYIRKIDEASNSVKLIIIALGYDDIICFINDCLKRS